MDRGARDFSKSHQFSQVCFFVCLLVERHPTTPIKSTRPAPPPPVPTNATYLFNLAADPEERIDLASERPDLVQAMVRLKRLEDNLTPAPI